MDHVCCHSIALTRVLGKQTQIYIRTYSRTLLKQEESLTNIKSLFYMVIFYFLFIYVLPLYVVAFLNQYLSLLFYLSFNLLGIRISKFQYIMRPSPFPAHLVTLCH